MTDTGTVFGAADAAAMFVNFGGLNLLFAAAAIVAAWFGVGAWLDRVGAAGLKEAALEVGAALKEDLVDKMKEASEDGKLTKAEVMMLRGAFAERLVAEARARGPLVARQLLKASLPRLQEWAVGALKTRFKHNA